MRHARHGARSINVTSLNRQSRSFASQVCGRQGWEARSEERDSVNVL